MAGTSFVYSKTTRDSRCAAVKPSLAQKFQDVSRNKSGENPVLKFNEDVFNTFKV